MQNTECTDARSSANQEDVVLTPEGLHACYLFAFILSGGDDRPCSDSILPHD